MSHATAQAERAQAAAMRRAATRRRAQEAQQAQRSMPMELTSTAATDYASTVDERHPPQHALRLSRGAACPPSHTPRDTPPADAAMVRAQLADPKNNVRRMRCSLLPEGLPARTGAVITTPEGEEVGDAVSSVVEIGGGFSFRHNCSPQPRIPAARRRF